MTSTPYSKYNLSEKYNMFLKDDKASSEEYKQDFSSLNNNYQKNNRELVIKKTVDNISSYQEYEFYNKRTINYIS